MSLEQIIGKITEKTSKSKEEVQQSIEDKIEELKPGITNHGAALIVANEFEIEIQKETYSFVYDNFLKGNGFPIEFIRIISEWLFGSTKYVFKVLQAIEEGSIIGKFGLPSGFYYNSLTMQGVSVRAEELLSINVHLDEKNTNLLKALEKALDERIPYVLNFNDYDPDDVYEDFLNMDPESLGYDPDADPIAYQIRFGFKCDFGRITELALQKKGLGSLPTNIGALEDLAILDLRGNQLQTLPESISKLKLEMLNVSNNKLENLPKTLPVFGQFDRYWTYEYDLNFESNPLNISILISILKLDLKEVTIKYPKDFFSRKFIVNLKYETLKILEEKCPFCDFPEVVSGITKISLQNQIFCVKCEKEISITPLSLAIREKFQTQLGALEYDLGFEIRNKENTSIHYPSGFTGERNKVKSLRLISPKYQNEESEKITISKIPDSIGKFVDLEVLYLDSNTLKTLPKAINDLIKLQELFIHCENFETIPEDLGLLKNLRILSIKNTKLTNLPDSLGQLVNLQELILENNSDLVTLPESLGDLTNLIKLSIRNTNLTTFPNSICRLKNLKELNLRNNKFSSLPKSFGDLINLQVFEIQNNKLTELPETISNLQKLPKLILNHNQLQTLPDSIENLTKLQILEIQDNQITKLPETISNLQKLEKLNCNKNKLCTIPNSIGNLSNLKNLILTNNQIESLPDSIGNLSNLEVLRLGANKFSTLPDSMLNLKSIKIITIDGTPANKSSKNQKMIDQILAAIEYESQRIIQQQVEALRGLKKGFDKDTIKKTEVFIPKPIKEEDYNPYEGKVKYEIKNKNVVYLGLFGGKNRHLSEYLGSFPKLETIEIVLKSTQTLPNSLGNLKELKKLILKSNFELSTLPDSIGQLENLHELSLEGNSITCLPESIGNLKNVQIIKLRKNKIAELPESIGKMENLHSLHILDNEIKKLPESIGQLKKISDIFLICKQLNKLPSSIGKLVSLKSLLIMYTSITSLPESIGDLSNLTELELTRNELTSLPEAITRLQNLQQLRAMNNKIQSIPESFGNLENLKELDLRGNQIVSLPESFWDLKNLEELFIDKNPIAESTTIQKKIKNLIPSYEP